MKCIKHDINNKCLDILNNSGKKNNFGRVDKFSI